MRARRRPDRRGRRRTPGSDGSAVAYVHPVFSYVAPPELSGQRTRRQVVIAGAGPIGLCAAIDLAQHGVPTLVVDDDNTVSVGSRAICYAKRTLEILDRLGCGA